MRQVCQVSQVVYLVVNDYAMHPSLVSSVPFALAALDSKDIQGQRKDVCTPVTPLECVSSSQCFSVSAGPGTAKMPLALKKSARMRHCSGHLQGTAAALSRCLQR